MLVLSMCRSECPVRQNVGEDALNGLSKWGDFEREVRELMDEMREFRGEFQGVEVKTTRFRKVATDYRGGQPYINHYLHLSS